MAPNTSSLPLGTKPETETPVLNLGIRFSPHWFYPDGDLLLKCGTLLYLVHSETLAAASQVFSKALSKPPPTSTSRQAAINCRKQQLRTNNKTILSTQAAPLSLSEQLWIRQQMKRGTTDTDPWTTKKQPKVLVVEDDEANVNHLLYFLYTAIDSPIRREWLPHFVALGIRYQIHAFVVPTVSILHETAKTHPLFVIRTLNPYSPHNPVPISPTFNKTQFALAVSLVYDRALSVLLDDFPRYHSHVDNPLTQEYLASVPRDIRHQCVVRWNKYAWDMNNIRNGELFIPLSEPSTEFKFEHHETCTRNPMHTRACGQQMQQLLIQQWRIWWDRETLRRGRDYPRPSRVMKFYRTISTILHEMDGMKTSTGQPWMCAQGVREEVAIKLASVIGTPVLEDQECVGLSLGLTSNLSLDSLELLEGEEEE